MARRLVWLGAAAAGAAVVVFSIALIAGGAASPKVFPGLPDAGALGNWGQPLAKLTMDVASLLTVGTLLMAAALLPSDKGMLSDRALGYVRAASWLALVWALGAAVTLILSAAVASASPLDVVIAEELTFYAANTQPGIALTLVVLFATAIALFVRGAITVGAAGGLLVVALATLLPPPLTGHSMSASNHGLATTSVALHVVALGLWVGGLAFICVHAWLRRPQLAIATSRFSRMAFWCFVAVGVTGVASVVARLVSPAELLTSAYGLMVLAKIAGFVVLGLTGWWHRRRTLTQLASGKPRAFLRLASGEIVVMAGVVGLAVALARTAPPVPPANESTARALLGYDLPPAISVANLASLWRIDLFFALLVVTLGGLYLAGVVRLRRRGDRWPVGRTVGWFTGLVVIVLVTQSGVATYAPVLFSVHMVEHMALSMLAPIFLVLGAPVTLALRAVKPAARRGDRGPREWLTALLNSRVTHLLTHPAMAAAIFISSTYVLYFSPLFASLMRNHLGHLAMSIHFLAVGCLFFWVIIGVDPSPHRIPYVAKMLTLFVTMPFHAFFGIALMNMGTVLAESWYDQLGREWGASSLSDQRTGGGIAWGFGEIPTLIVLIALVFQWFMDDQRRARREDRRADRAVARGERDELAEYNDYLASLEKQTSQKHTKKHTEKQIRPPGTRG